MAVGALYIRRYYNQEDKHAANDLVANVRREFINILHGVTWMDEPTKNLALEKAKLITSHVGYPDELLDDKKVDEHYKLLELEPDNLFVNTLRLSQFNTNFFFGRLHKPVNKTDWVTHAKPAVVNAAYSPLENSIRMYRVRLIVCITVFIQNMILDFAFCRISCGRFTGQIFLRRSSTLFELWCNRPDYRSRNNPRL